MIHLRMPFVLVCLTLGLVGQSLAGTFPEIYNTDPPDHVPMPAAEAAKTFKMPPGFKVSLFAAEPDVQQPIAMTFDAKGRLWVAEDYTYADAKEGFATNLNDRIVMFEDADNDGHFDKRTVFWDQGKILTSIEIGRGGVFALCAPKLLFIPDRDGDGVPDGEPQVLLDGFDTTTGSRHTFANGLRWGPDGWLWGRVGISSTAHIGLPGTPANQRLLMAGGIWRYHPERKVVEVVAQGTTNPWGMDWNEVGEPFFINTVIGHLWHAIPGAHFRRMYGDDPDPHTYGLIEQHADHFHFDTGAGWTKSRAAFDGSSFAAGSDSLGGGHAHAGLMIYQADNWPAQYRGRLFTLNLHGRRINEERLERSGSGYVGRHEPDFLSVGDTWFRGIDLIQGPDGGVFISDWSDTGECHDQDGIHRTSGRIYKVTYGDTQKPVFGDLQKLPLEQLVPLLFDRNEWLARHARQALADRRVAGLAASQVTELVKALRERFSSEKTVGGQLHALWALHVLGALNVDRLIDLTENPDEHIRSWAIRLLVEYPDNIAPLTVSRLIELGRSDASALVRLYLASALQRLPLDSRRGLADALVRHAEDVDDHNLGLMIWYGIEPLVAAKPDAGVALALASRYPVLREYIARRYAEDLEKNPAPLDGLLALSLGGDTGFKADLVRGMSDAVRGWHQAKSPKMWATFAAKASANPDPGTKEKVRDLGILFGDGRALDELRGVVTNANAVATVRLTALKSLLDSRADNLVPLLKQLINDTVLRHAALIGLVQLGDPEGPALATGRYASVPAESRPALLAALVARPASARVLLDAVAEGKIPRVEVTPFLGRQISSLNDAALSKQLVEVWGVVRPTAADKRMAIERFRGQLTPANLSAADLSRGRQTFTQLCAPCHRLYGEGGQVGPDLTGSGRANLDYLLDNVIDPSAVVPADFRMAIVTLKDGRVLNGVLREPNARTITVQTQTERAVVERSEITTLETSEQSMMPEGLLESLKPNEARDLVGYLMHQGQVALPAGK